MDVIALAKVGRLSWSIPVRTFVGWEPFYPKVSRTRIIAFYPLSPGKRLRFFGFASFLYIVCYPHSYYVVQRFNFPLIPLYFLSSSTLRVQLKASQLTPSPISTSFSFHVQIHWTSSVSGTSMFWQVLSPLLSVYICVSLCLPNWEVVSVTILSRRYS